MVCAQIVLSQQRQAVIEFLGEKAQEFKLKADRRSVIIRAVGFTIKIVVRGFVTFIFMRRNKNKAVTLRSIVFKYPGFTARCWLSVGWGISGTSIRFMGFNSLYGYVSNTLSFLFNEMIGLTRDDDQTEA